MTVKRILSIKGSDVTTIEATATIETAIGILAERRIGALVVLGADHRVIGILSERRWSAKPKRSAISFRRPSDC